MALAAMVGFADHSRRHDVWPIGMHGGARACCGGVALRLVYFPALPQRLEIAGKRATVGTALQTSATHLRRKASTAKPVTAAAAAPINILSRAERARNAARRR